MNENGSDKYYITQNSILKIKMAAEIYIIYSENSFIISIHELCFMRIKNAQFIQNLSCHLAQLAKCAFWPRGYNIFMICHSSI